MSFYVRQASYQREAMGWELSRSAPALGSFLSARQVCGSSYPDLPTGPHLFPSLLFLKGIWPPTWCLAQEVLVFCLASRFHSFLAWLSELPQVLCLADMPHIGYHFVTAGFSTHVPVPKILTLRLNYVLINT